VKVAAIHGNVVWAGAAAATRAPVTPKILPSSWADAVDFPVTMPFRADHENATLPREALDLAQLMSKVMKRGCCGQSSRAHAGMS
jgi:hypothetical protein